MYLRKRQAQGGCIRRAVSLPWKPAPKPIHTSGLAAMDAGQAPHWLLRMELGLWHLHSAALGSFASPPKREAVGEEGWCLAEGRRRKIVQEAKMASEV